jgi:hypothetical protein
MMINFFRVAVDVNVPARSLVARPTAAPKPAAE